MLENALLRQQLIVLKRQTKCPKLTWLCWPESTSILEPAMMGVKLLVSDRVESGELVASMRLFTRFANR
jgi:hypothetical protein